MFFGSNLPNFGPEPLAEILCMETTRRLYPQNVYEKCLNGYLSLRHILFYMIIIYLKRYSHSLCTGVTVQYFLLIIYLKRFPFTLHWSNHFALEQYFLLIIYLKRFPFTLHWSNRAIFPLIIYLKNPIHFVLE